MVSLFGNSFDVLNNYRRRIHAHHGWFGFTSNLSSVLNSSKESPEIIVSFDDNLISPSEKLFEVESCLDYFMIRNLNHWTIEAMQKHKRLSVSYLIPKFRFDP
jgi:hypothetical protein